MKVVVLDINCLIQILPRSASHRWLFDEIQNGTIALAVTTEILLEYEEIIDLIFEPGVGSDLVELLLSLDTMRLVEPSYRWTMITKDADDDKYVDCAVAANVDYLISNDRHFAVLDNIDFPKITRLRLNQVKKSLFN